MDHKDPKTESFLSQDSEKANLLNDGSLPPQDLPNDVKTSFYSESNQSYLSSNSARDDCIDNKNDKDAHIDSQSETNDSHWAIKICGSLKEAIYEVYCIFKIGCTQIPLYEEGDTIFETTLTKVIGVFIGLGFITYAIVSLSENAYIQNIVEHKTQYRSNLELSTKYASIRIPETQYSFMPMFEIGQGS